MTSFKLSLPVGAPNSAAFHIKQTFTEGITDDERNKRYDDFAKGYDDDVKNSNYQGPLNTALALASVIPENERGSKLTLDIGAGTGLVGEEMQKLGFKTIDALEPSKGMLDRAIEKGVYRKCICDAIGSKPLDIPPDSYDIITVVGSHGPNHIESDAIYEMIRLVKSGGFVCIITRMENFTKIDEYKDSFFPLCDQLEKEGKWKKVDCSPCSYLQGIQGIKILYQVV